MSISGSPKSGSSKRQGGALFGRRKGHTLRPRQAALMETLLPKLALNLGAPAPANLTTLFPERVDSVRLEIGFGGGEHLASEAAARPTAGFIGCEPFVNGMAKALALIEQCGLSNIRLHLGDASEILDWLPPHALTNVDLLFPDPWPKRRHWKRRFIQDHSIEALARVLRPGGTFRCATDIADYAAWTLERFLRCPAFVWTAERADDWRRPWPGYAGTRYEAKAKREGRVSSYFVFQRLG